MMCYNIKHVDSIVFSLSLVEEWQFAFVVKYDNDNAATNNTEYNISSLMHSAEHWHFVLKQPLGQPSNIIKDREWQA